AKRLRQLDPTGELPSAPPASGAPAAGSQRGGGFGMGDLLPELDLGAPVKPAGREARSAGAQPSSAMPLDYEGALELPMLDEPDDERGQRAPTLAGLQTSPADALPGLELSGPATDGASPGHDLGDIDALPGLEVNGPGAGESLPDLDFGEPGADPAMAGLETDELGVSGAISGLDIEEPETDAALAGVDVDSFGALDTRSELDE